MLSHAMQYDIATFQYCFNTPCSLIACFTKNRIVSAQELSRGLFFVTCNRYLWLYKEQCMGKSIFVLRPLWDIMINSECDFGIKHWKLNSVIKLWNTVFGRQHSPNIFSHVLWFSPTIHPCHLPVWKNYLCLQSFTISMSSCFNASQ